LLALGAAAQSTEQDYRDAFEAAEAESVAWFWNGHACAMLLLEQEELDTARKLLERLHEPLDQVRDPDPTIFCWSAELRARLELADGMPDRAAPILRPAIELAWDHYDPSAARGAIGKSVSHVALLGLLLAQAEFRMATGEHELLVAELEEALELRDEDAGKGPEERRFLFNEDTRPYEGQTYLLLAVAHVKLALEEDGHEEPARRWLARACSIDELLPSERFTCAVREGELELILDRPEAAREALARTRELLGQKDFAALPPIETAFLCALEARLARRRGAELELARDRLGAALERLREVWRERPHRKGGHGYLRYDRDRLVVEELLRLEHELSGPEAALDVLVEVQRAVLPEPLEPPSGTWLEEIRRELVPAGGGLLVYFPGVEALHLFAIDADSPPERRERASETELHDAYGRFDRAVATPPERAGSHRARDLEEDGRWLAEELLPAEIRERLERWGSVTLLATGSTWDLPFRALPLGDRPLGAEKAVSFLPSLALGLAFARRGRPAFDGEIHAAVIGAPPSPEGYPPLAVSDRQWRRLLRAYGSGGSILRTGEEATAAALLDLPLSRVPVVQLLAHGVRDPGRDRRWGMVLHAGELWSSDLEALPEAPRGLVILSSCGSGTGPQRVGEELEANMGGVFLWSGAQAVMLSRADATLEATLAHTAVMHDALAAGESPAEALRRASAALIETGDFADPFHHAVMRVVGLGHRPLFEAGALPADEAGAPWVSWIAAGAAAVLVLVLLAGGRAVARRRAA